MNEVNLNPKRGLLADEALDTLKYRVGALMYTPALNAKIALTAGSMTDLDSLALCLEDSITESGVEAAERQLFLTLQSFREQKAQGRRLPNIFIRPRSAERFSQMAQAFLSYEDVITGYICPKFTVTNGALYADTAAALCRPFMPILESRDIIGILSRASVLSEIKDLLRGCRNVLNIRVGGADFCGIYGLRRGAQHTIYDIEVVKSAIIDVLNLFGEAFVVSAPVFEYFAGAHWQAVLRKELALDRVNGFIGKTAIHPNQLPIIRQALKIDREDYDDAVRILNTDDSRLAVSKGGAGTRMNELPVHYRWAKRMIILGDIYGITNDNE
jgi:citrate lyase beta subunit